MVTGPFTIFLTFATDLGKCLESAMILGQFLPQFARCRELCDQIGPAKLAQNVAFALVPESLVIDVPLEHECWNSQSW